MTQEVVRCPYCVLGVQFRPMAPHLDGRFICEKCGHTALADGTSFACSCERCEELNCVTNPHGCESDSQNQDRRQLIADSVLPLPLISPLSVCPCDQQNCEAIEDKHETQVQLGATSSAFKFFPRQHAPQRRHHRRRLADRVGNRHPGEVRSHQIKDHPRAPDDAAEHSEQVSGKSALERIR